MEGITMSKKMFFRGIILCIFFGVLSCDDSMNGIYNMFGEHPFVFVNSSASASGDGESWETAYTNLPEAITTVQNGRGEEIWMTAGSYSGTITAGIKVSLYGGFSGTETSRDDRDIDSNATSLDLTVSANGVVIDSMNGFIGNLTIRGNNPLTIEHGTYQNEQGGTGVLCYGTVVFSKCLFTESPVGGLLCEPGSQVTVEGCTFISNSGSTIEINSSTCTINNSTIKDGNTSYTGGGVNIISGTCTINNSTIENCKAGSSGCGIYSDNSSTCTIVNSTIRNNSGGYTARGAVGGGGIYSAGILTVKDSVISDNKAAEVSGGGIYNDSGGTCTIESTTVSGNTSSGGTTAGGGICIMNGSTQATITGCVIDSNTGVAGGGVYSAISVTIADTDITRNTSTGSAGGGIYAPVGLTATNTKINGNCNSGYLGGGILAGGTVTLKNCQIENNYKTGYIPSAGGGIFLNNNAVVSFSNCYFVGNRTSGNGSQICILDFLSSGTISNCTIENDAGNGVYNDGSVTLSGTIWL
jgi:hypothetical protein